MASREITDEQAGEIAERLETLDECIGCSCGTCHDKGNAALAEIRRLLGFPA